MVEIGMLDCICGSETETVIIMLTQLRQERIIGKTAWPGLYVNKGQQKFGLYSSMPSINKIINMSFSKLRTTVFVVINCHQS